MVFYLKVNRNSDYAIRNVTTWLNVCGLYNNSICYVICDNGVLSNRIAKECNGYGQKYEIISSYRRTEDYSLIKYITNSRWEKAGLAHLTTFLHAADHHYKKFWNIDADDTRLCLSVKRIKTALDEVSKYADDNKIDLFSLDMWRSRVEGHHWSFGVTYTNGCVDWKSEIKKWVKDNYNYPDFSNPNHPKNIDEFFTYLRFMSKQVKIETFYIENLLFVHFGDDLIYDPIQSGIYHWTKGEIEFPILYAIFGTKSIGKIEIYEDCYKIDIGISAEEGKYQLAKYANYSIETTNVLDAEEYREEECEEIYNRALEIIRALKKSHESYECILFGKGLYVKYLIKAINDSNMKLRFIVDNSNEKQGHICQGYKIFSPDKILDYPNDLIFIGVKHYAVITKQLLEMGVVQNNIFRILELN